MTDATPSPTAPPRVLLVHYAEIGLKGLNRRSFERRLRSRLEEGLAHAGIPAWVGGAGSRVVVEPHPAEAGEAARERAFRRALSVVIRIPGVANVAPARVVPPELEAIREAAATALAEAPPGSFKVDVRRADKSFPMNSIEVAQAVAPACLERSPRPVDVHGPSVTVRVEIAKTAAYVSAGRFAGPGGLPVGSTSRLLSLVSGGIDSAVATWLMIRRGARVTVVHFHNRTHEGPAVLEKLEDLCGVLAWSAGEVPLLVVPFEACQRAILAVVPAEHRMIVYRRAMLRIAGELAKGEKALGLVTGDSLGQVASQTAENLRSIHAAATLPLYSPLIGSDKAEIIHLARRIGTYDISIRPHADCCSFLIAPHPTTASRLSEVQAMEEGIDWATIVPAAAAGAERSAIGPDPAALPE